MMINTPLTAQSAPATRLLNAPVLQLKQAGSTLVVSLMILIILMLLGVTTMVTSDTQYKLAGNMQFEKMALDNAEIATYAAEQWLETNKNSGANPPTGVAALGSFDPFVLNWSVNSTAVTAGDDSKRYVIHYVSSIASPLAGAGLDCFDPTNERNFDCVNTYLVTARGLSNRGAAKFIQTYYAVPFQ